MRGPTQRLLGVAMSALIAASFVSHANAQTFEGSDEERIDAGTGVARGGCDFPPANLRKRVLEVANMQRAAARRCGNEQSVDAAAPVVWNKQLAAAARAHAKDMASNNFFDPTGSDGLGLSERAEAAGYIGTPSDEIIVSNAPSARKATTAIVDDPKKCARLTNTSIDEIGAACVSGSVNTDRDSYWSFTLGNSGKGGGGDNGDPVADPANDGMPDDDADSGSPNLSAECTPEVELVLEDKNRQRTKPFFDVAGSEPETFVQDIASKVCRTLYKKPSEVIDRTKITLTLLNDRDGFASALVSSSPEVELQISTDYLQNVANDGGDVGREIQGILFHEITHLYQQFGDDSGELDIGLIEGIADTVRFKNGFIPDGAEPNPNGSWNDGYRTTAFFLLWIDEQYESFIYTLNLSLSNIDGKRWTPGAFKTITGKTVDQLWSEYVSDSGNFDSFQ